MGTVTPSYRHDSTFVRGLARAGETVPGDSFLRQRDSDLEGGERNPAGNCTPKKIALLGLQAPASPDSVGANAFEMIFGAGACPRGQFPAAA